VLLAEPLGEVQDLCHGHTVATSMDASSLTHPAVTKP